MLFAWIQKGLFGGLNGDWWTIHNQLLWAALMIFSVVAAWFDVRERRIPNAWNLSWLGIIVVLQIGLGSGMPSVLGALFTGTLLLIPTLCGVWGQGDWKMAMVCGAALGVLPTLVVWWLAMLLAKGNSILERKLTRDWFKIDAKSGLPVAAFVMMALIVLYTGMSFV